MTKMQNQAAITSPHWQTLFEVAAFVSPIHERQPFDFLQLSRITTLADIELPAQAGAPLDTLCQLLPRTQASEPSES